MTAEEEHDAGMQTAPPNLLSSLSHAMLNPLKAVNFDVMMVFKAMII